MAYLKKELKSGDKEMLLQVIEELQLKLKKKNSELHRVRTKLNVARTRMIKMKDTVEFQRKRIIELYA
jgi:hypothetical protein